MALMTITLNDPSPQLATRAAKVAFATRALQIAISELGSCGGNDSSGNIVGLGADGAPHTSLGFWAFDTTES
jgi:hypothetical protein